jgi:acetyl/propionyl-CoA carboxylase alpha subunit
MGCDKTTNDPHFENNTGSSTSAPENNDNAQTNNSCSMWEQVSTEPSPNLTENGTYCAKDGVTYKCKDATNSITMIGNCPSDMKTSRALYYSNQYWDQAAFNQQQAQLQQRLQEQQARIQQHIQEQQAQLQKRLQEQREHMQQQMQEQQARLQQQMAQMHQHLAESWQQRGAQTQVHRVEQSIEQSDDDLNSSEDGIIMNNLQQQIKDCKKWEATSNSITQGGLYCNDQSGQMFRCLVNPNKGNTISQGGCPDMQAPPMLMI